ncbi:MAG TPA: IS630 family transposase [Candidatus Sulfotelmatobacter sp.]|nr:IS630 family transposase [Candidatus Sulfotelmatobacter sp.]
MWEAAQPLRLSRKERELLEGFARTGNTPQKIVLRIRIVLRSADGIANHALAAELRTSRPTVLRWRRRFEQAGVEGLLEDAPRPGRKRRLTREKEEAIVNATLYCKPTGATHWSVRTLARAQRVSPATVHRVWKAHRLQPHRVQHFKLSPDPQFFHKVHDIVGLYLHPPEKALLLSVDEKSQIQALDRSQPILPLRPGIPERHTHDYARHGTTTLFAALNVLSGEVVGDCMPRHRHQEFLRFLERIERTTPRRLAVHLILDNYGTHTHPAVEAWFATHPRYHRHFTPTGASWLNLVERFFAEITDKRIRRGTFRSVGELVRAIRDYIRRRNHSPQPFMWTASARSIARKVRHCNEALETGH